MNLIRTKYDDKYFKTINELPHFKDSVVKHRLKIIRDHQGSGELLEIGCGHGQLLSQLNGQFELTGMDISEHALEISRQHNPDCRHELGDIETESLPREKYDVVVAFDVLEHLKKPTQVMNKVMKSLKKNGVFVFSVPNNHGFLGGIFTRIINFFDRTHISTYTRKRWIELVKKQSGKYKVYNQHILGITTKSLAKFYAYNLIIVVLKTQM